ncbi:MAG TPA: 7TM diverse intracellular signaling domain-containing protein, partial [Cytophagaceae bacterium]
MFIRFLFSITLVLSSVVVMAQPVIQFTGDNINIGKSLLILKDSSNTLTFDEVINNDNFQLSEQKVPNLGISNSTFWLKFKIQNHTDSKLLLLDLSQPGIDHIEFYKIDADGRVTKEEYGESLPYSKRNYSHPDYVFNLKINEGDIHTYLLKVKSGEQIQIPLTLGRPLPILEALATKDMLFGLYVGIMSVMLLYNLFIYFSIKDKSYLFYVIYIFIVTLTQANFQGYAFRFLWPESSWVATNAVYILSAIVGMSAAVFMMFFLNTRQNVPHLHKGLFIFITIYIITILMGVSGFHNLSFKIVEINAMLTALYQLYISFIISKQGYRPAKFFLYAWIIFLIGVCIFVLKDLGVLPYNNFTYYTMPAGSAIEVVLLSFGLADRINILKKEKEESQAKALEILKENERIIKEQNILLERKVRERTLELEEANKEISRTLHDLKETQSQLVNAEKMASLGQLTAGIAHEMNNPINFVASNVKPLKQDVNDLLELLRKYDEISLNVNLEEKLKEVEALKKEIDIDYLLDEIDQLLKGIDDGASRTTEIVKGLRNFSRLD